MGMRGRIGTALALGGLLAAAVATPAPAVRVTITTDDAAGPTVLSPSARGVIRNMDPTAAVRFEANDAGQRATVEVVGPRRSAATDASSCQPTDAGAPSWSDVVDYRGNGDYAVVVSFFNGSDAHCQNLRRQVRYPFRISAHTAVGQPGTAILLRPATLDAYGQPELPIALNPGAGVYEVRYARDAILRPDGSIRGATGLAYVDPRSGRATFDFRAPGRFTIVARAAQGAYATPWSTPVRVRVMAPFAVRDLTFPDPNGPRFRVRVAMIDPDTRGSVAVAVTRADGPFRPVGTVRLDGRGRISFPLTLRGPGRYRLRFSYAGSRLVARGVSVQQIRITRRR